MKGLQWAVLCTGFLCGQAWALSLDEALLRAGNAPEVAASRAGVAASAETLKAAGQLPDPRIVLTLDELSLEGDSRYHLGDSKRMIGLMQSIPPASRREAQRRQAEAMLEADGRMHEFTRLTARQEASLAWIQLYFLTKKEALLRQQANEIQLRQKATTAALAGGGGADAALESLLDKQSLDDDFDLLRRDIRLAHARLARWIGPFPASEMATGDLPVWLNTPANTNTAAIRRNTENESENESAQDEEAELSASRARIGVANAELMMAESDKTPDWDVELGMGQDAMGKAMMMAKVNFSLPVFTSSRQNPRIAAARLNLEKTEAEHALRRVEFQRQREELLAEEAALNQRLNRLNGETLPLLERKVALNEAAFSGGRGSASAFILARENRLSTQIRALEFEAERCAVRARLYFLQQRGGDKNDE
jgi:outer membrane protein TolC